MRKAIVIGIILSIAVLIAVVVYLFNTKKEGFQDNSGKTIKQLVNEIPLESLQDGETYYMRIKPVGPHHIRYNQTSIKYLTSTPANSAARTTENPKLAVPLKVVVANRGGFFLTTPAPKGYILGRNSREVRFRTSGYKVESWTWWKMEGTNLKSIEGYYLYFRDNYLKITELKNIPPFKTNIEFLRSSLVDELVNPKMTNIPLENEGKYRIKITDGTKSKYVAFTYERSRWRYKTIPEDKKVVSNIFMVRDYNKDTGMFYLDDKFKNYGHFKSRHNFRLDGNEWVAREPDKKNINTQMYYKKIGNKAVLVLKNKHLGLEYVTLKDDINSEFSGLTIKNFISDFNDKSISVELEKVDDNVVSPVPTREETYPGSNGQEIKGDYPVYYKIKTTTYTKEYNKLKVSDEYYLGGNEDEYRGDLMTLTRDLNNGGIFSVTSSNMKEFFINKINFNDKYEVIEKKRIRAVNSNFKLDPLSTTNYTKWSKFSYDPLLRLLNSYQTNIYTHAHPYDGRIELRNHVHHHTVDIFWRRTVFEFIDVTDEIKYKKLHAIEGPKRELAEAKKLEDLYKQKQEEYTRERATEQAKIDKLKADLNSKLTELTEKNQQDLESAQLSHNQQIASQRQDTDTRLNTIRAEVNAALASKQTTINNKQTELENKTAELNLKISQLDTQHANDLLIKQTEINNAIRAEELKLETFKTNNATALAREELTAQQKIAAIDDRIKQAQETEDARYEEIKKAGQLQIEEIESSLEVQKKNAQSRLDLERKKIDDSIKEIKQMAYSREKNAKLEAIKKVQDEIDQLNRDVLAVEEEAALKIAEAEEKIKQAMANSPAKKYVKSKVKISPDIQKYINEELAKYSDKNSLPTVTQLEQLKKLSTDNSAEKLASIPGLLKKFSDNTQSYMDFHNSYEDQLKEILETKFDAEKRANIEIQKRNATRLNRLKSEITNYADVNKINLMKQEIKADTSKAGTLRNIGDGTMLNFDKTNDNKHVVLKMSGEKMIMQDGELKKDANGEVQGCLTFDSSQNRLGTPALTCCNINNSQSPELSFRVSKINNKDEYNKLLTKISPETKSLATDYDTINYPFSVVEPQLSPGYCVSVEDQKVRILPCEKESNQRYRKLNYQVKKNCGLN